VVWPVCFRLDFGGGSGNLEKLPGQNPVGKLVSYRSFRRPFNGRRFG
jgi:hypothetical protein